MQELIRVYIKAKHTDEAQAKISCLFGLEDVKLGDDPTCDAFVADVYYADLPYSPDTLARAQRELAEERIFAFERPDGTS